MLMITMITVDYWAHKHKLITHISVCNSV